MKCYLLAVCSGSSLDQHSNNITLFNLVEQLNFPPHAHPPEGTRLPLEIHAYFELRPEEIDQRFDVRFALVESNGLETLTNPSSTSRRRRVIAREPWGCLRLLALALTNFGSISERAAPKPGSATRRAGRCSSFDPKSALESPTEPYSSGPP